MVIKQVLYILVSASQLICKRPSHLSGDADTSIIELGHWLVALKDDIIFDMSSITRLVEFVKR